MVGKKLERWCDTVRTRAENMLPSSLNTPTGALLLSSEILNVLTMLEHSATMTESVSDNDSECDGKTNMILTEEEEKFAIPFQPVVSKIDKTGQNVENNSKTCLRQGCLHEKARSKTT